MAVEQGTAYLRLGGGCQGCAMATVTLSQGIEAAIIQAVPEITSVVDVTDHQTGTNPYFEAAKKYALTGPTASWLLQRYAVPVSALAERHGIKLDQRVIAAARRDDGSPAEVG